MKPHSEDPDLLLSTRGKNSAEKEDEKSEFVDIKLSPPVTEQPDEHSGDEEISPKPLQLPSRRWERPRILRNGEKRRPRKAYAFIALKCKIHRGQNGPAFWNTNKTSFDKSDEWHDAMVLEIKSILQKCT